MFRSVISIHLALACGLSCAFSSTSILGKHDPARPAAHILLYSDAGYANPGQYRTAEAMARRHAEYPFDFAVSAGDNLQLRPQFSGPRSMINIWGDGGMDEAFGKPFEPLVLAGVRFYAALGNHDHQGLRRWIERRYGERVDAEARGAGGFVLPAPDYALRRNGVRIVFLDVATAFSNLSWSKRRARFARSELGSGSERWTILVFHYPLWSSGEHGRDRALADLRRVILPILDEYPVDFVVSGHDHHAELFHYSGKVTTRLAIVGNTAKPHELPFEPELPGLFRANALGFAELDIRGDRAELTFRSAEGAILFREVVRK